MTDVKRLVSSVLLAAGVLLVFIGLSTALGFTAGGMVASLAAIAALLYAGAVWFTPSAAAPSSVPAQTLFVFDAAGRVVSGPGAGQPLTAQFPEMLRAEIERRSAAALNGITARFVCLHKGQTVVYDALPVRSADGAIVYGILLTTQPVAAAVAATA
jgi:hypothetical protein